MANTRRESVDVQLERDVCKLVQQFAHRLEANARHVGAGLGLTAGQVIALRELSEPITARELAARMQCEPSNATYILDRLEELELIERRPHPADRRAKQIVLTPSGGTRRDDVLERLGEHSPLGPLTSTEQESLRGLLRAVATDE